MFLEMLLERNPALTEYALFAHGKGLVLPDTYMVDLDTLLENAAAMKREADICGVRLYYMLKQLGRNPLLARALDELDYVGAVAVDFREALTLAKAGARLGNVGHLVQPPRAVISEILKFRPEIVTVYSAEKALEVAEAARSLGITQKLMLRVTGETDEIYSGQECGFSPDEAVKTARKLREIAGVRVSGVCSFPCFLYDEKIDDIVPTHNAKTVCDTASALLREGFEIEQINLPSAGCTQVISKAAALGGTHLEPGHGLSGTTPWHAKHFEAVERPAYVYISEISHRASGGSLCYGGGHYRRGHVKEALVSDGAQTSRVRVTAPSDESIDYHFWLDGDFPVSACVLMCFRTQIFVTRSRVAIVSGLSDGRPRIEGVYSSLGERIEV